MNPIQKANDILNASKQSDSAAFSAGFLFHMFRLSKQNGYEENEAIKLACKLFSYNTTMMGRFNNKNKGH